MNWRARGSVQEFVARARFLGSACGRVRSPRAGARLRRAPAARWRCRWSRSQTAGRPRRPPARACKSGGRVTRARGRFSACARPRARTQRPRRVRTGGQGFSSALATRRVRLSAPKKGPAGPSRCFFTGGRLLPGSAVGGSSGVVSLGPPPASAAAAPSMARADGAQRAESSSAGAQSRPGDSVWGSGLREGRTWTRGATRTRCSHGGLVAEAAAAAVARSGLRACLFSVKHCCNAAEVVDASFASALCEDTAPC
jgi:hypothetical protein